MLIRYFVCVLCLIGTQLFAFEDSETGRYQISTCYNEVIKSVEIYVVDTKTGNAWRNSRLVGPFWNYGNWEELPPLPLR